MRRLLRLLPVLALVLVARPAGAVEIGEIYSDTEVAVLVSTDRADYEVGEQITLTVQVENRSARTLSLPGLDYSAIEVRCDRGPFVIIDAAGAPPLELAPGSRSPIFAYPFNGFGPEDDQIRPEGDYTVEVVYLKRWHSPSLTVRIRATDPAAPEKWQLYSECVAMHEPRPRDGLMHAYLANYPEANDPLSYRLGLIHLAQAVTKYCSYRDTESRSLLDEIGRMIEVFGPRPEIYRYQGALLRQLGRESDALDALVIGDPQAAMDWMETIICGTPEPTPDEARMVLAKVPALLARFPERNDRERLLSTAATAWWFLGEVEKAIAMMEPIIPEEAARWREELTARGYALADWPQVEPTPYLTINLPGLAAHPGELLAVEVQVINPGGMDSMVPGSELKLELGLFDSGGRLLLTRELTLPTVLENFLPADDDRYTYGVALDLPETMPLDTCTLSARMTAGTAMIRPRQRPTVAVTARSPGPPLEIGNLTAIQSGQELVLAATVTNALPYPVEILSENLDGLTDDGETVAIVYPSWIRGISAARVVIAPGASREIHCRVALAERGGAQIRSVRLRLTTSEGPVVSEWTALPEPLWVRTAAAPPPPLR